MPTARGGYLWHVSDTNYLKTIAEFKQFFGDDSPEVGTHAGIQFVEYQHRPMSVGTALRANRFFEGQ
jgi:hypothetical protein